MTQSEAVEKCPCCGAVCTVTMTPGSTMVGIDDYGSEFEYTTLPTKQYRCAHPSPAPASGSFVGIVNCPPHYWSHAPTVGYYRCCKCAQTHHHGSSEYAAIEAEQANVTRAPAPASDEAAVEAAVAALKTFENDWYWAAEYGRPFDYAAMLRAAITAYKLARPVEPVVEAQGAAKRNFERAINKPEEDRNGLY